MSHAVARGLADAMLQDIWAGRETAGFALPPFRVDHFTLFSSYLAREGAIYRAEAEYPLTEAA